MSDEQLMRRALELAEQGRYSVSPNPMVGCVIVRDGAVIAEGWHRRAGEAHAEVDALSRCANARGATMYVTLEPCAHHGRTPPCADAVIAAGIARVVIATIDPNEQVQGRGAARLRDAGIRVEAGVLETEARRQNEKFLWAATHKLPFVLLKAGMTLDGKLATVARESQWITSEASREKSLALREEYDAILIGRGSVDTDDPRLTRRLQWNTSITPWTRVVLDGDGTVSPHARIFHDGGATMLITSAAASAAPSTVDVVSMQGQSGRLDLEAVLRTLYDRGIRSVIVEGGSLVHSDFIRRGLWQKMVIFVAPAIIGGANAPSIFSGEGVSRLTDAYRFRFDRADFAGSDLMITAYPA